MALSELLFWQKYRPKSFKQLILLKRIDDLFKNGIQTNYIFHGTQGTGKSSLAKILCNKKLSLEINASVHTSIDQLRDVIIPFVNKLNFDFGKDEMKIIFLDEFEKASEEYQKALKAYIEEVSSRARFIFVTNHLNDVYSELADRCTKICFDPLNSEERDFLKSKYNTYLKAVCKAENIKLDDEIINKIINKCFPSLRSSIQFLQDFKISNNLNIFNDASTYYLETFNFVLDGNTDINATYDFVVSNYILREDILLLNLGRPFFTYMREKNSDFVSKCGQDHINLCKNYNKEFNSTIDQTMHVVMFIIDLKNILKKLK